MFKYALPTISFTIGLAGNFAISTSVSVFAQAPISEEDCKRLSNIQEKPPAPVSLNTVRNDIRSLRTTSGQVVIESISPELDKELRRFFAADAKSLSKLEQFYGMLYCIVKYRTLRATEIIFDHRSVYKLLLSSRVFSTPQIPEKVRGVRATWDKKIERAHFEVDFGVSEVRLPLNEGKGFSVFREGLCQTARQLVFYGGFKFAVDENRKGHIFVHEFENVDLFGTFGARGIVDVDIQYVALKSVEFLAGSPLGVVKSKVSKKEWEINEHSLLLRLVASMVTDRSTQPIDW